MLDSLELRHATALALDMLAQPAKRSKVGIAAIERAPVNLLLMARASQVTIQIKQPSELGVTKNAFIGPPIPRLLRRNKLNVATFARSKETRWVGNHVGAIIVANPIVNEAAIDT